MIKMITSDMDGTLLAGKHWPTRRLPHDFGEVLDKLDALGVRFLAASGRTYPSVRANFGEYADRIDYICDNGGCLVHKGEIIHEENIPLPEGVALLPCPVNAAAGADQRQLKGGVPMLDIGPLEGLHHAVEQPQPGGCILFAADGKSGSADHDAHLPYG